MKRISHFASLHRTAAVTVGLIAPITQAQPSQTLDEELAAFVDQYIAGQGIEYHADVTAELNSTFLSGFENIDEPISGSFSSWARDDRYAQQMTLDPNAGYTIDKTIAFDGTESQSLTNGILVIKAGAVSNHGRVLPDPLGEAIQFLYPLSEDHPLDSPQFTKPFSDPQLQAKLATADWIAADADSAVAEFPGGTLHDQDYIHRIEFDRIDGAAIPRVVERRENGAIYTRLRLDGLASFQTPQGQQIWPADVTYTSFAPDGTLVAEFEYDLISIDATGSFEDDVFTIPMQDAEKVWDAALGEFVN